MDKKICRFCKYYTPDGRYKGVIGICEKHDKAVDLTHTCEEVEQELTRMNKNE